MLKHILDSVWAILLRKRGIYNCVMIPSALFRSPRKPTPNTDGRLPIAYEMLAPEPRGKHVGEPRKAARP